MLLSTIFADLSDLGEWLSNVKNLINSVREIADTKEVRVMRVERSSIKSALIESLRKHQQFIHQFVTK